MICFNYKCGIDFQPDVDEKYCSIKCRDITRDRLTGEERIGTSKMAIWRKNNPEKVKLANQKYREKNLQRRKKKRQQIISHYSQGKNCCNCCGFSDVRFLTIDHIKPLKRKSASGGDLTGFIVKNNFPDGIQILCYNCNMGKSDDKDCPHKLNMV